MVRVVLVGNGYFGSIYRERIKAHPDMELVGVCDPDYDRVCDLEGCTITDSYSYMRQNVNHDAVVICTPPQHHADIACDALTYGKHVLCMKPGGVKRSDAARIERCRRASGKVFMVDYTMLAAPEHAHLHNIIGAFGRHDTMSTTRRVAGAPKPEGIIIDLLSHDISYFLSVYESWDGWSSLEGITLSCRIVDGKASLTLKLDDKQLLYATASYNANKPEKTILIRCKPYADVSNPGFSVTWDQNQRFISVASQGEKVAMHFKHNPDPITRRLDMFCWQANAKFPIGQDRFHHATHWFLWAAEVSANNDGQIIEVPV